MVIFCISFLFWFWIFLIDVCVHTRVCVCILKLYIIVRWLLMCKHRHASTSFAHDTIQENLYLGSSTRSTYQCWNLVGWLMNTFSFCLLYVLSSTCSKQDSQVLRQPWPNFPSNIVLFPICEIKPYTHYNFWYFPVEEKLCLPCHIFQLLLK